MAAPGWYPDPASAPGRFRHWDGAKWSAETTGDPAAAAPGRSTEPGNRWLGVLVLALLLALVLGGWWWFGRDSRGLVAEDNNTSTPTVSGWDEQSSSPEPSASEEPTDSGGRPVACPEAGEAPAAGQPANGRYAGGGLSFAEIPGWENSQGWGVDWGSDTAGQRDSVTASWVAVAVVGELDQQHFPNPRLAVQQLASCEATSFYYSGITGRRDLASSAVTIDGRQGWHLRTEITVEGHPVAGDVLDIVALDAGRDGRLAFFLSEAPIGDQPRQQLATAARESLRVEG